MPILYNLFQRIEAEEILPNSVIQNYIPISFMNLDVKILHKIIKIKFNKVKK